MDKTLKVSDLVRVGVDLDRMINFETLNLVTDKGEIVSTGLSTLFPVESKNWGDTRRVTGIWNLPGEFSDTVELIIMHIDKYIEEFYAPTARIYLKVVHNPTREGETKVYDRQRMGDLKRLRDGLGFPYLSFTYKETQNKVEKDKDALDIALSSFELTVPLQVFVTDQLSSIYQEIGYKIVPDVSREEYLKDKPDDWEVRKKKLSEEWMKTSVGPHSSVKDRTAGERITKRIKDEEKRDKELAEKIAKDLEEQRRGKTLFGAVQNSGMDRPIGVEEYKPEDLGAAKDYYLVKTFTYSNLVKMQEYFNETHLGGYEPHLIAAMSSTTILVVMRQRYLS